MSGIKTRFSFAELQNLPPDDLFTLVEEIPSGEESDVGDEDENKTAELENNNVDQNLFDPIIFENDQEHEEGDSEDELPLSEIRRRELEDIVVWTNSASNCLKNKKQFREDYGPNIPDDLETPTEVFLQIFPKSLIEHLVFQTNLYAVQKNNRPTFTSTNFREMKTFLGLNLMMGIKRLPSYSDYWSSRPELRDTFISTKMSRDRFKWLLGNLHANDNSLLPRRDSHNYDKLYKLRPVIEKLCQSFLDSYKPSQNQSIDESMIRFKGRSCLKQYMPLKPIKRGYKVWVRADSSGYVCEFQIYTGKIGDASEKDLGGRVVKDLTKVLVGKGHHVYFDNFFNSVWLQKYLQSAMIYACGTVKRNRRNLPKGIQADNNLERGESDFRVSLDGLVYVKWKDRKAVNFLCNHTDPSEGSTANRRLKDGTLQELPCPPLVTDYNKNMGHVDKFDMLKSCYEIDRKSKKWWHRIFWYLLDAAVVNSHILFNERAQSKTMSLKIFGLSVILGLIGSDTITAKRGRPSSNHYKTTVAPEIRFDSCAHMPVHGSSRRCAFCSSKAQPHRTRWMCSRCDVGLCLSDQKNCFVEYHAK